MRGKFIDVIEEITNLPIRKVKSFAQGGEPPQPRHGIARQASLVVDYGRLVDADEESTVAEQAAPFGSTDVWEVY